MNRFFACLMFVLPVAATSCSESQDADPSVVGWDFYPLETGLFHEYDVMEVDFNALGADTLRYSLRTELVDTFVNQAGTITHIMYRYEREEDQDPWTYHSTWTVRRDPGRLVVYEESVPYLKLSFPVENNRVWDGNSLNANPADDYMIQELNRLVQLPNGGSSESLTVIQEDFIDTVIGVDFRVKEIYARNTGLVMRESRTLNYCIKEPCANKEIPEAGHIYLAILSDYGKTE